MPSSKPKVQSRLQIALSPCPNDTFAFHAWIADLTNPEITLEPIFADIETLNVWALEKKYPITKLSFPCFAQLQDSYELLDVGCALGLDLGPKVIATRPMDISELKHAVLAIPGQQTTAHFLARHLLPLPQEKVFCTYDEVYGLLHQKKVDAAVVIHESRFTFAKEGFFEIADLGKLWNNKYSLPLPLGGIAIRKDIAHLKKALTCHLKSSLHFAHQDPKRSFPYVQNLSQEKDPKVIEAHISLYVNNETLELSALGKKAIEVFLQL